MEKFLKKFSNFIVYVVTLLGIFAIFSKEIEPFYILVVSVLIIFGGFVTLLITHISKLEKKIRIIGKKFIKQKELESIRADIKSLKLSIK